MSPTAPLQRRWSSLKILLVQESDWLRKGPHQQHYLMERLSSQSDQIRVIDFEVRWTSVEKGPLLSRRQTFRGVSKIHEEADITLVRPGVLKMPLLDFASILYSHTKELRLQIARFSPDVVIGFGILNALLGMALAGRSAIPFLYYLIDELHTLVPYRILWPLAKLIESHVIRHAQAVLVINEKLRDFALGLGADPQRTYLIRAGVDPKRFFIGKGRAEIREQYGIRNQDLVLFFMGGIFSFSGVKEVAQDLAAARSEHPEIKFLIVGRPRTVEFREELESVIEENNLQETVILEGWQPYDRIPLYLAASDICLLPAYDNEVMHNIVPIKIYEYIISGKPVISTRLPGIVTEFGFGNGVSYVDGPSDVIRRVIDMIESRQDLQKEGERARAFVQRYTWDSIVDTFKRILEEIVGESKVARSG